MRLTGRCRREFEEWYIEKYEDGLTNRGTIKFAILKFHSLPYSLRWHTYILYFKSVGINTYTIKEANKIRNKQLEE